MGGCRLCTVDFSVNSNSHLEIRFYILYVPKLLICFVKHCKGVFYVIPFIES